MPQDFDLIRALDHLTAQFERGRPILFTGAGFSLSARQAGSGAPLPSVTDLKQQIWALCFPSDAYHDGTQLQALVDAGLRLRRKDVSDLLQSSLTVDADSLPNWYERFFSLPWTRIYTLNIDDLARAASRRFQLPRNLDLVSALHETQAFRAAELAVGNRLEVIHLNGDIDGVPDRITFSITQYAERLARPEPWYVRLTADLVSHPFIFVGTQVDEPPLWQHLELRRARGARGLRELRPRSYLVTPSLDPPRRALLGEYNIIWVPMTAQEFEAELLSKMGAAQGRGIKVLAQETIANPLEPKQIPTVAQLATNPTATTEFLLGEEPIWADVQSGRAILRDCDEEIWNSVISALEKKEAPKPCIIVTGTAGSGKSASLMRGALRLTAEGKHVGWLDAELSMSPREIRQHMRGDDAPSVLIIDDADLYRSEISSVVRELTRNPPFPLIMLGIRSARIDAAIHPKLVEGVHMIEYAMPPLADSDVDTLIDVLDRENRLGRLKGQSRDAQRKLFQQQAGRQLLVAMIQATSGRRFEEKVVEELTDLGREGARAYGLIAVASAYRFGLERNELLLGLGESSNTILNIVDQIVRRRIVRTGHDGALWTRHRVIAEVITKKLEETGQIKELIEGLAHIAATQVTPGLSRSARSWRLLRQVINHDFLFRVIQLDPARNLYGDLETLLRWDFHYWLQRGSLEVEFGDLALAENFLNQSRGLAPDDTYVENEYAYLLFRKAIENPVSDDSSVLVDQAVAILANLIDRVGERDAYPYHVLGSQGMAWVRRGIHNSIDKDRFLRSVISQISDGCANHPRAIDLKQLLNDLKKEHLQLAVPAQKYLIRPNAND